MNFWVGEGVMLWDTDFSLEFLIFKQIWTLHSTKYVQGSYYQFVAMQKEKEVKIVSCINRAQLYF